MQAYAGSQYFISSIGRCLNGISFSNSPILIQRDCIPLRRFLGFSSTFILKIGLRESNYDVFSFICIVICWPLSIGPIFKPKLKSDRIIERWGRLRPYFLQCFQIDCIASTAQFHPERERERERERGSAFHYVGFQDFWPRRLRDVT